MKLEQALRIMMATVLSTSSAHGHDDASSIRKLSSIEDVVGTGCRNTVDFHARFKTDEGAECVSSTFCDGSAVSNLFVPKAKDVCLKFDEAEANCNMFEVVTEFDEKWMMKHITLKASGMLAATDPKSVTFLASNDSVKWEVLHTAEVKFPDRKQQAKFVISNDSSYKYYSAQFHRDQNIMHLGKYGLVEDYTKACTSQIHAELTGDLIPYYTTLSPTSNPTNAPTSQLTDACDGYQFNTKGDLETAVINWIANKSAATSQHGHIQTWCVGGITNMQYLFNGKTTFNEDLSSWDMSAVTAMDRMFQNAQKFNSDLSDWNVSAATEMSAIFQQASVFNSNLSDWNVSAAKRMENMFYGSSVFNSNLSDWNVSAVTNMRVMFGDAKKFNFNLSDWNVSGVTNMQYMFYNADEFDQVLCWDASNADLDNMFNGAKGGKVDAEC